MHRACDNPTVVLLLLPLFYGCWFTSPSHQEPCGAECRERRAAAVLQEDTEGATSACNRLQLASQLNSTDWKDAGPVAGRILLVLCQWFAATVR